MNISKLAEEIFKLAQGAGTAPDAPSVEGEEQEVEYDVMPLAIKNSLTKIRLRPAMFKKITKVILKKGVTTYKLFLKQTRPVLLEKRYLKILEQDRNFKGVRYDQKLRIMYFEFEVLERTQVG